MVDTPKTADDFDNMTDEDFLKLNESDFSGDIPEGETSLTDEALHAENQNSEQNFNENESSEDMDLNQSSTNDIESDDSESDNDTNATEEQEENEEDHENQGGSGIDPMAEAASQSNAESEISSSEQSTTDSEEKEEDTNKTEVKEKSVKQEKFALPDNMTAEQATYALDFFSKITTPFKADGKDFTVRTPEDAIRLMQQGVNYSRRMQEIKPMKVLNRMLQDHGLNDPEKISFLIDISKGNKEAINKLLKDNNLDPMDLDTSEEIRYETRNYAGNPQDNALRDALDNTTATPDGQALVSDIHSTWDDLSKAKLRENPGILGNLLELKQSGVYEQVVAELTYQRSMGYLTHTPYLEAFDQVGEAMKNAGVLKVNQQQPAPTANPLGHLQSNTQQQVQPVAQGTRKAPAPKKATPNPHLSSTPPSKQSGNQTPKTPDFDKLSDEEFLKMAPPS